MINFRMNNKEKACNSCGNYIFKNISKNTSKGKIQNTPFISYNTILKQINNTSLIKIEYLNNNNNISNNIKNNCNNC